MGEVQYVVQAADAAVCITLVAGFVSCSLYLAFVLVRDGLENRRYK